MNDEDKMFRISVGIFLAVLFLMVGLQVCYRTQNRALRQTRNEIVRTQQDIAKKQAQFESLTRSEFLRGMVDSVNPSAETIGFQKYVSVQDLKMRE
ncbi:MAG: hypothetical protein ACLRFI_01245 [Alphaproteobacteria bacterium]